MKGKGRGERSPGERSFSLLGAGRMGTGLALALVKAGWRPLRIWSRKRSSIARARKVLGGGRGTLDPVRASREAPLVVLGVPDDALSPMVDEVARGGGVKEGSFWIHLSGFHGLEPLRAAARARARVLGIHPLQTVPDPREGPARLAGAYFSLVGAPGDLPFGKALVEEVGGRPVVMPPGRRPLYHAAAVLACNDFVALFSLASRVLERATGGELDGRALLVLVRAALEGLERLGPAGALTGPVARGDLGVVEGHLEALGREAPWALEAYRCLGLEALRLARLGGGNDALNAIERKLRAGPAFPRGGKKG